MLVEKSFKETVAIGDEILSIFTGMKFSVIELLAMEFVVTCQSGNFFLQIGGLHIFWF